MKKLYRRSSPHLVCLLVMACAWATTVTAQSRGITLEPLSPTPTPTLSEGQYRALIIGNNNYQDPAGRWPSLKTAVADARAVAELLKTNYGFNDIQVLENANRRDILLAMAALSQRALPQDNVLIYYAGHGFIDLQTERGYWVPVDANGTDQTTFLRNSTIRDELGILASRTKHTLLISDSCFSGTLLREGSRGVSTDTTDLKYYQKVAEKKSVQILTAGGNEYVDDDYKNSGHSPFTYFLLSELKANNQPVITASELSSTVEKIVANNVEQTPASGVLQGAGDELGEFIFLKIKVDVQVEGISKDKVKVQVQVVPQDAGVTATAPENATSAEPSTPPLPKGPVSIPLPTL